MLAFVFGMGCFWGAEKMFWKIPGVYSTSVGYAGGYTPNPTYEETCTGMTGHAEVVQVVYDPAVVSYEQLLKVFWERDLTGHGAPRPRRAVMTHQKAVSSTQRAQCETAHSVRGSPIQPRGGGRPAYD